MEEHTLDDNLMAVIDKITDIKRSMLWKISEAYNLTPLQIQILLFVKACPPKRHVSAKDIVKELYVSKATTSSAVLTLLRKGLLTKKINPCDNRSYYLSATVKANRLLEKINKLHNDMLSHLRQLPEHDKKIVVASLVQFAASLIDNGVIDYLAVCITCTYCSRLSKTTFYCSLTKRTFEYEGINVGCSSFTHHKAG